MGGGGSQRNRFMGTYGNFEPRMSTTQAAAAKAAATASGYNARNTAFNSGDPYWDNMRNRFGFGPIDAIANQGRSWGGAIGTGVGMAVGSQFGEMGMMAGAMGGQFAGQAAGYMATTGVGRQMLITGAERVAKSGIGQFAARFAGGVAGGAAVGAGGAAASGFLGGGVAASAGAAALPIATLAALGYGANRATSYLYGREEALAIGSINQRNYVDNSGAERTAAMYGNIRSRLDNSGFRFGMAAENMSGMMGLRGNELADQFRAQRGRMTSFLDGNANSRVIRHRMRTEPEYQGDHLAAAQAGIGMREALLGNMDQELGARASGLQAGIGAYQNYRSAGARLSAERRGIDAIRTDMGLMGGRESAEFTRISAIMMRKGKLNVTDLQTLQSIAGRDAAFGEYVRKEGDKLFESRGFKKIRKELVDKGIISGEESRGIGAARQDFYDAKAEWEKSGGQTIKELQTEFDAFLKALVTEATAAREEIERLKTIVHEIKPANAGS
jgi:polyhydroxyalkanoate synthesis regulator phasin